MKNSSTHKIFFELITLFLVHPLFLYSQVNPLVLSVDSLQQWKTIPSKYISVLIDEEEKWKPDGSPSKTFQDFSQFPPYQERKIGVNYWFKIKLSNSSELPASFLLNVDADYTQSYLIHNSGKIDSAYTGMMVPFKDKTVQEIKNRKANLIALQIPTKTTAQLFLQTRYSGLHGNPEKINYFSTVEEARLKFIERSFKHSFSNGFFQAILLLIFLYCLFFTIYAKADYSFYLTIYCLFYSLYFLNSDGQLFQYTAINNLPFIRNHLNLNLLNIGMVFDLLFMKSYLDLKHRIPLWNKIYSIIMVLAIIISIGSGGYYFFTQDYKTSLTLVSIFQLFYLIPKTIFLGQIWLIKDFKLRIFAFAWTLGHLLCIAAWFSYWFDIDGYLLLKLGIGSYLCIVVLSFSYFAAKSSTDKLIFEKEVIQKQLALEMQERQQLEMEKENALLHQKTTELQQLDQLKTRFYTNVSHELRTPLTLILSPLDTVLKRNKLESKDYNFLKIVRHNGRQLLDLINEILDLSKLQKQKMPLLEKPVLLHSLINICIANFEPLAESKEIQISLDYQPESNLSFILDKKKFEKILNNLLSNALKFTSNGGEIKLILKELIHNLELRIIDTGKGIHPDDLPYVFDRFYQTSQTNIVKEGGTGIGLALSLGLAKLMGGNLWVESQYGEGSTFFFSFPKKEIVNVKEEIEEAYIPINTNDHSIEVGYALKANTTSTINPANLLIVEDNDHLRYYLETILSEKFNIQTANNGVEAFDKLMNQVQKHKSLPHLILSDVMMPKMDGFQFLKKLKTTDQLQSIPVIMLTAKAELRDKLRALRMGVDDYLTKPFEQEELFVRIENLLKNAANRREVIKEDIEKDGSSERNITTELSKKDLNWLQQLEQIVWEKISDIGFSSDDLAQHVQLSRRQLSRRVKKCTGLSPSAYIKEGRLNKARQLLETGKIESVKRVAIEAGFLNIDYFGQQFKERFGKLPSEYI